MAYRPHLTTHCPVYFDLTTKPGSTFCTNKLSLYSGDLLSDLLDRMASTGDDIAGNHNNLPVGGELPEAGFLQSEVLE